MKNLINKDMSVEEFIGKLEKNEKIIRIASVGEYAEDMAVYIFTKRGMIKKTLLKEFAGDFLKQSCYKFKYENDEVVSVDVDKADFGHLVMITKKGMAIRFPVENVNPMGKVASGVTGISLKDDDAVIFGKFNNIYVNNGDNTLVLSKEHVYLTLITKNKEKEDIRVNDIKLQNRAGRGTSVMMLVLDDEIKSVSL